VFFTGAVEATFNGDSSVVQYSNTLNTSQDALITFSFRLRTRDSSATILYLRHSVLAWFISIQLSNGKLQVRNISGAFVADGSWHEVAVTYTHNMTVLTVDGSTSSDESVVDNQVWNSLDSSCEVFIGADPGYSNHFKGCLDNVRINSLLLPFFMQSELANDTSVERFDVVKMTGVEIGCHGDDVCNSTGVCLNNGTCRDVWNAHECDCVAGFNGTFCELDVDECVVSNDCANGSTCVNEFGSYSCICAAGFTGLRYELEQIVSNVLIHESLCL